MSRVLVAGAGGFIGGHLVGHLVDEGHDVHGLDIKEVADWWQPSRLWTELIDLRETSPGGLDLADWLDGYDHVYNLACDMGGMGFIANHRAECMLSVQINANLLDAARRVGVERYFFASSACVYPSFRQDRPDVTALAEDAVYPADPEDGYGWEKLFSERLCRHFTEDYGLVTRVARYHNVYGPHGAWTGGREKAPAAICRKVATAVLTGRHEIEIWGDGEQTRSFMHIDDCIEGTRRIMDSSTVVEPINLGSAELVSINQLVDVVEQIAGVRLSRRYVDGPQGVRGRNSDNTRIRALLGWEPSIPLVQGLEQTYRWVYDQVRANASFGVGGAVNPTVAW